MRLLFEMCSRLVAVLAAVVGLGINIEQIGVAPDPHSANVGYKICTQRYGDGLPYNASPLIIDGVSDRIKYPVPDTCKMLLAYRTGAMQVKDADGEDPTAVGSPSRDMDARRYRVAAIAESMIGQGYKQQSYAAYNKWRYVTAAVEALADMDARDVARAKYDGEMLDNCNHAFFDDQGGSFVRLGAWSADDSFDARTRIGAYVRHFKVVYRSIVGRDPVVVVNLSRCQVWYPRGRVRDAGSVALMEAVANNAAWLQSINADGVMVENPLKYAGTPQGDAVQRFCEIWRDTGRILIIKRLTGSSDVKAYVQTLATPGSQVYLSDDGER